MSVQILIVDDHEGVRRGLRSLISSHPDWTICGEAADGLEAIEKARSLRPAIVLMDISMPRMNGLEATRVIRECLPETRIIIISQNDPATARLQALEVGAAGYVAKTELAQHLLPTISKFLGSGVKNGTERGNANSDSSALDWLAGVAHWAG